MPTKFTVTYRIKKIEPATNRPYRYMVVELKKDAKTGLAMIERIMSYHLTKLGAIKTVHKMSRVWFNPPTILYS